MFASSSSSRVVLVHARARRGRPTTGARTKKVAAALFRHPLARALETAATGSADDPVAETAPGEDAREPEDAWTTARRAELSALTVEKGLKPLCRGYGLKLGGSKGALLERVLAHEVANKADMAPMEAVVERASAWRSTRIVAVDGEANAAVERRAKAQSERRASAGGWGRGEDEEDEEGDDRYDDAWGAEWNRTDDVEGSMAYLQDIEARYPELVRADAKVSKDDLARRIAIVDGLRSLAKEKKGYEADTGLHLEAIARAIERGYRDMRGSALNILQKESKRRIDVSVDIDVARGRFAVLAQVVGRAGTVEREYDDTKFFTFNIRRQNRMRTLIRYLSEEIKQGVARKATEDFVEKIGTVCDGRLRFRSETGAWMVDIDGGAAGVIPENEQLQLVNDQPLKQGDTVTAYVLDVENNLYTGRERTPVVLSMTIPDLVVGIVKSVVPEVARGDIEIKAIARVPGRTTKVAVQVAPGSSCWDAIETCVGQDMERLRVIRERAGGEVVHFINWSDDPAEVIKAALYPADVKRVEQSFPEGSAKPKLTAFVTPYDIRRAIGAGGANVKLAAALTDSFVLIETLEGESLGGFNDDLDDRFDNGAFWGGDDRDFDDVDDFDSQDARDFTDILSEGKYGEKKQGIELDELGWPELPDLDDLTGASSKPPTKELKSLSEALGEPSVEDIEAEAVAWEVGPGRPGIVTFGDNGQDGIVGETSFFGRVRADDDDPYADDELIFD
jgi:N utilization substance protein A